MNVVLMRHAEREKDKLEEEAGLTPKGREKATETAFAIKSFGEIESFDIILHGKTTVARETAGILRIGWFQEIQTCTALSPGQESKWSDIKKRIEELLEKPLHDESSVALVGHDPGISSLLSWLTAKNCRIIGQGEAVLLTGTPRDMDDRYAIVVRTFGSNYSSELLRKKVEMKMTVSTFLAGFSIAVLVELVKEELTVWRGLATGLFTLALGLFVVAVYTYDALLMPPDYWGPTTQREEPKGSPHGGFAHNYRLNGPLFAYMMRTWVWIFTPAVFCTSIAFLLLLVDHFATKPSFNYLPHLVFAFCFLAIVSSIWLCGHMHPRLGFKD